MYDLCYIPQCSGSVVVTAYDFAIREYQLHLPHI